MTEFQDLTLDEKLKIRALARAFYEAHTESVRELYLVNPGLGVAPSGLDLFHPELWKGIHWRWFRNVYINVVRIKENV